MDCGSAVIVTIVLCTVGTLALSAGCLKLYERKRGRIRECMCADECRGEPIYMKDTPQMWPIDVEIAAFRRWQQIQKYGAAWQFTTPPRESDSWPSEMSF